MVRPVDLQDNFSKAPLASRAQQVQQANPEMAQRQGAQELAEQHAQDQARTLPAEEGKAPELHADQRREELPQRRRRRERERREETEDESAPRSKSDDSSFIDIVA